MSKAAVWLLGAAALVLALALGWRSWTVLDARRPVLRPVRPVAVDVATARVRPVPRVLTAVGEVESEHSVKIRPQVSGLLQQVYFAEGRTVSKGQRLFLIDPAPYQVKLASAKAAWEAAKAQLVRVKSLIQKHYSSPQELDTAQASADQAEASYRQAQIDLSYTDIRAPIAGRSGSLTVKSGNLVSSSDTAPLVTINQMAPILVRFSLPQQQLAAVRHYQARGPIKVFVTHEDGSGELDQGSLVFIDNSVDATTGTVTLKARVPNARQQLWPGQFVGVRVQLAIQPDAVVIPETAIQVGQSGNFVYKVVNGKAVYQAITVDRQFNRLAVVSAGLQGGEQVVAHVPRNLGSGSAVTVAAPQRSPAIGAKS